MLSSEQLEKAKSKPGKIQCHDCGKWFSKIGTHWALSECSTLEPDDYQKEVLTGILMGDGSVYVPGNSKRPMFVVKMIKWEFLYWFDNLMGNLSTGLKLEATAKQCADRSFGEEENYNPQWRVFIRACDFVDELHKWYASGKKTMPEDIEMTPTVLKLWYVCDGALAQGSSIVIGCDNEHGNGDKICSWFKEAGLPEPSIWENDSGAMQIRWRVEESKILFDYMGSPPPGFEYKWP